MKIVGVDTYIAHDEYDMLPELCVYLQNIEHNYSYLRSVSTPIIGAVIKGNGYGLGRNEIFKKLYKSGCRHFFIADWQEVYDLDQGMVKQSNIYALSGVNPMSQTTAVEAGITPVLHTMNQLSHWAKLFGKTRKCVLQIDTGLNRLGLGISDAKEIAKMDVDIEFVINHLSCGYTPSHELNRLQAARGIEFSQILNKPLSGGSSCSWILDSNLVLDSSNIIRAGRFIYGIKPNGHGDNQILKGLKPASIFTAPLITRRYVSKGEAVGYDCKYIAPEAMEIGILNIGYSSSYYFLYPEQKVFLNGQFCRIVSQSMDFMMIDITNTVCEIGDKFELFGENISQDNSSASRICIPGQANIVRKYYDKT